MSHRDRGHRIRARDDALARVPTVTRWMALGSVGAVAVTAAAAAATTPGRSAASTTSPTSSQTGGSQPKTPKVRQHRAFQRSVNPPAQPPPVAPPPVATSGGS